jgi:hypothetical protein
MVDAFGWSGFAASWFAAFARVAARDPRPALDRANDKDLILTIADRKWVFSGKHRQRIKNLVPEGVDPFALSPVGYLSRGVRGDKPEIVPWYDGLDMLDEGEREEGERQRMLDYHAALDNAVGLARVNVSLAIRRAFLAVIERRQSRGELVPGLDDDS